MLWKIREQEPVSQESMAGIAVRLEEKKRGILELFGRPKSKTWSSNGVDYYIGSELGEWSGLRKGKLYTMNVPRHHFTHQMRREMNLEGRIPPRNMTYLFRANGWILVPAKFNPWSLLLIVLIFGFLLLGSFLIYGVPDCKVDTDIQNFSFVIKGQGLYTIEESEGSLEECEEISPLDEGSLEEWIKHLF